ncbi:ABC transporter substrate-binding protein [Microvirga sp. W0021]|uniref:ABC transporter substrate-binding protein n=1 Tax=Hohaiivirga grylli TaxID=3133970 RepID=A0ABV0BL57_9HYPH
MLVLFSNSKILKLICTKLFLGLLFCLYTLSSTQASETLNIYSTMPEKYSSKVFEAFTKQTGIKTQVIRLSAGEALARIEAESRNPQADILFGGPDEIFEVAAAQDLLTNLPPAGDGIPERYRSRNEKWHSWGLMPLVFMANTNFLEKNGLKAPKSWQDLLNPAYANSLQMADARTSGTATERIYALAALYGETGAFAYQKQLHKNIQLYTKSGQGGAIPIATGQAAAGIFYLPDALDTQQQGYPVIVTYPEEGTTYGITGVAILKGTRKSDTALKLVNWLESAEFANVLIINKINYLPLHRDAHITEPMLDISKVKLIDTDMEWRKNKRQEFIQRWISDIIQ